MGLLDNFNMDDPKNMGLLQFGLSMLGNSGPSSQPKNFGQIFGASANAGMQSIAAAKQKAQADELLKLKMLEATQGVEKGGMELAQMKQQIADKQRLQDFYKQQRDPMAQMQQAMGGNLSPTVGNAAKLDAMLQGGGQGTSQGADVFSRRMAEAEKLRSAGFHDQADAVEKNALQFRPEFATDFRQAIGPNGKLTNYLVSKDGTLREAGVGVKPDMAELDLGGYKRFINKNDVAPGQQFQKSMTPGEIASNGVAWANHNNTVAQQGKPVWNNEVGAFISPPSAANPNGRLTDLAGYARPDKPLTESQGKATAFAMRMQKADELMSGLNAKGTLTPSIIKQGVDGLPLVGDGLGALANKYVANSSQQELEQSQRDFVNAVLRQESGASISPAEFDNARRQYFPQPGDVAGVIAQKAANRKTAIEGMKVQSGPGAKSIKPSTSSWSIQRID